MTWFKDITEAMLGVIIAFLIYAVLTRISNLSVLTINVFSLAVIYFSIKKPKGGIFHENMEFLE